MTVGEAPFLPARLHGRPVVTAGYVWVGDMAEARAYLETFRARSTPAAEQVDEMRYVELQSSGDERHHHGLRRYTKGHYLTELSDAAIDAYLARGVPAGGPEPDWSRCRTAASRPTAARSPRSARTSRRSATATRSSSSSRGATWLDPAEDADAHGRGARLGGGAGAVLGGVYVNVIADARAEASAVPTTATSSPGSPTSSGSTTRTTSST